MLKTKCIHPDIIAALALCGHGDKVLIADGNYPLASKSGNAQKVYLALSPDIPRVTDGVDAIREIINVETIEVMEEAPGVAPKITKEFTAAFPSAELVLSERFDFYKNCSDESVKLAISTGETRLFANLLITVAPA